MHESLALPVTVLPDGRLRRDDRSHATGRLIGVMASTSRSFWPHAPWFGLLELFEEAKSDVSDLPRIADAINVALRELGIDGLSILAVRNAPAEYGERGFNITITEGDGVSVDHHLKA